MVGLSYGCGGDGSGGGTTGPPDPPPPPQNSIPIAIAGADQNVSATLRVELDGSGSSDPDAGSLTFLWSIASAPNGSTAALDDPTMAQTGFVADLPGTYIVQLVVNDGTDDSTADQATITAVDNSAAALIGPAGGEVQSKDGNLTLTIPAGALAVETEIRITLVSADQLVGELEPLQSVRVVYDFQPDGLQLAVPASAELMLPDAAIGPDGEIQAPLSMLLTLSDGEVEALDDKLITADGTKDRVSISASIAHFSPFAEDIVGELGIRASGVPDEKEVDTNFDVIVSVPKTEDANPHEVLPLKDNSVAPVQVQDFDSEWDVFETDLASVNTYACTFKEEGVYSTTVPYTYFFSKGRALGGLEEILELTESSIELRKSVKCIGDGILNLIGHFQRPAGSDWSMHAIDPVTFDVVLEFPFPAGVLPWQATGSPNGTVLVIEISGGLWGINERNPADGTLINQIVAPGTDRWAVEPHACGHTTCLFTHLTGEAEPRLWELDFGAPEPTFNAVRVGQNGTVSLAHEDGDTRYYLDGNGNWVSEPIDGPAVNVAGLPAGAVYRNPAFCPDPTTILYSRSPDDTFAQQDIVALDFDPNTITLSNLRVLTSRGTSSGPVCLVGGSEPEVFFADSKGGSFSVLKLLGDGTVVPAASAAGVFNTWAFPLIILPELP